MTVTNMTRFYSVFGIALIFTIIHSSILQARKLRLGELTKLGKLELSLCPLLLGPAALGHTALEAAPAGLLSEPLNGSRVLSSSSSFQVTRF